MHAVESCRSAIAVLTFAALATACGGGDPSPSAPQPSTPSTLAVHGGAGQQAAAGEAVPIAPSVVVRDAAGEPVAGVSVAFAVASGGGTLQGATPTTNASGVAAVSRWTLGPSGTQRLTAQVSSLAPVEIQATITPGTEFTAGTIGGAGGTITIDDANSPYDGLTLTAPAGIFPSSTSWNLRVGTLSPTFQTPAGFSVAGPPLLVQTGALRGNGLMTLEVPVSAGPNDLVFLALHDPVRGVSELLTTIERKAGSVVVATSHLRGDLLPDPATVGTVRAGMATLQDDPQSQVVPILLDIMSLTQATLNRWSIADHGTASHPDGVGAGIAGLQWVASVPSAPRFDSFVKSLDIPGFYAEPGPLAAVELAQEAIAAELLDALGHLGPKLDQLPKAQRDQIVHQNLVAWMRFAQRPALFTFQQPGLSMPGAALVTSADGNGMTVEVPSAPAPVSVGIGAVGYAPFTFASGGLVPVGSTIADFSALDGVLTELVKMTGSISNRLAANEALAAQAGLPVIGPEIRIHPNEAWTTAKLENLIARQQAAEIRVLVQKATFHLPSGLELARTNGEPVSIVTDLGVGTAAPGTGVLRTISTHVEEVGGALRQLSVAIANVGYAPFDVTPDQVILTSQDLDVDFTASVQLPPDDGFRIAWDWGDGQTSENLGLTNASHTYAQLGTYEVVARLLDAAGTQVLAVDTVQVREQASAWVGEVTGTLTDATPNFQRQLVITATGVRFVPDISEGSAVVHRVAAGQLTLVNNVPCANYVSPVIQLDLSTQGGSGTQWLDTVGEDPNPPAGTQPARGLWYRAGAFVNGIQILNKPCISPQNPSPQVHVISTAASWLITSAFADPTGGWYQATDPDVLQGSFTRQSGNITETWSWRFVRVDG